MSVIFCCWAASLGLSTEAAEEYDKRVTRNFYAESPFDKWVRFQRAAFLRERPEMAGWTQATDDFDAWLCAKFAPGGFE